GNRDRIPPRSCNGFGRPGRYHADHNAAATCTAIAGGIAAVTDAAEAQRRSRYANFHKEESGLGIPGSWSQSGEQNFALAHPRLSPSVFQLCVFRIARVACRAFPERYFPYGL